VTDPEAKAWWQGFYVGLAIGSFWALILLFN